MKHLPRNTAAILLATTQMALAHGSQTTHAHPHAEWSTTIASVLALGAFAALFLIPMEIVAKARSKHNDPR